MKIIRSHSTLLLAVVCAASGCATGVYDSIFDGLDKIVAVHLKPGKPVRTYPGSWSSREPGRTYGHETTSRSVRPDMDANRQNTTANPQLRVASNPPRRLLYENANPEPYTPGTQSTNGNNQALAGSFQAPFAAPSVGSPGNETTCDALERRVWEHYRRFEFSEVFSTGTTLAGMSSATPSQRAIAFILMGSTASIQGNTERAREYFRKAIQAEPSRLPDPGVFPSTVLRLYSEVASERTEDK